MSLASVGAKIGNSMAKAASKVSKTTSSFGKTTTGKIVKVGAGVGTATAAVGAGTALAGAAVGAGASAVADGINDIENKTVTGKVIQTITGTDTTDGTKNNSNDVTTTVKSYVTIGLVIGIILLAVFVVVPQIKKNHGKATK